jgi:ABC-2 type transport system permease protein
MMLFSPTTGRRGYIIQFLLLTGILLALNVISGFVYTKYDLTEEKRFTLTQPTRKMLQGIDGRIYVRVLLEGNFPAGFKRLQESVRETLDQFRSETGYIDYVFEDPSLGGIDEVNARRKALAEEGIQPINLKVMESGEMTQKIIYPIAILNYGERTVAVKLLENESPGFSNEEVLANSVDLLEYKFASAIKKVKAQNKPTILFTTGHGELDGYQTIDLRQALSASYETGQVDLESIIKLSPEDCALLMIAKPRSAFSEREKFKIDQYIMQGGSTIWMIDALNAELDSMGAQGKQIPQDYKLNLEDMLFKYGVRIHTDLVFDNACTKIPLQVGQLGNAPQLELFKWFFHPAVTPNTDHPVAKNLDVIEFRNCSSIEPIDTRKTDIKKTVLLKSSQYSRVQFSPMELSFDLVRMTPDLSKLNKGNIPLAMLLEGSFLSNYENRISQEMRDGMAKIGITPLEKGKNGKMIIISDGDIAANYARDTANWKPLGYNRYENRTYANKDFMLNCVDYLTDPNGIIEARAKEIRLRKLDEKQTTDDRNFWIALNFIAPLLLVVAFLGGFWWWRKRVFTRF